jgi:protein-disulfide isomerase
MFRKLSSLILVAVLVASTAGQARPKPKNEHSTAPIASGASAGAPSNLPSEETVNSFLQQTFGYDSSVSWKILSIRPAMVPGLAEVNVLLANPQGQQSTTFYASGDGTHAVVGEIIPFGAKPFAPAQNKLKAGINGIARGPENAAVTIVEFSDLECPHCKQAQPVVDKLLAEEPNVRFVYQHFPLPMHSWAAKAADFADCVGRRNNDAFWKFIEATYNAQSEITDANADAKLTALAASSGVNGSEIAACAAQPDTRTRVEKSVALGKSVDVTGTPTLFINGRKISSVTEANYELLKKLVDFAAKQ